MPRAPKKNDNDGATHRVIPCPECKGTGVKATGGPTPVCPKCLGSGRA